MGPRWHLFLAPLTVASQRPSLWLPSAASDECFVPAGEEGDGCATLSLLQIQSGAYVQRQRWPSAALPPHSPGGPGAPRLVAAATSAELRKAGTQPSTTTTLSSSEEPPPGNSSEPEAELSTAAEAVGVTLNAAGDLNAFLTGLVLYGAASACMVCAFMILRNRFPLMYSNNVNIDIAPSEIPDGCLGWLQASWATPTTKFADHVGVDMAMLLEYSELCMRILAVIGIPMCCIGGPMNYIFGGFAAEHDYLSYFSFGNIEYEKWHYWVYAFVVWAVCFVVQDFIFKAQKRFCEEFRYKWLRELPEPRATTVLVEDIPEAQQSDEALKQFFESLFATGAVSTAFVVKDTQELLKAQKLADAAKVALEEAQARQQDTTPTSEQQTLQRAFEEAQTRAEEIRLKVLQDSENIGGVNLSAGFVTFKSRTDALIAENVTFSDSYDNMVVSIAPPVSSIIWEDLREGPNLSVALHLTGYALVVGLYIAYLPITLWISKLAVHFDMGAFQSAWQSVAPTLGIQIMVAMLPTFLIQIFKNCFVLKDTAWAQLRLQNWYFVFQVVFVIAVTAIGNDAMSFARSIVTNPTRVPTLLGTTMPYATHFYMNFMVLQWMSHSMNLTRYFQLIKYLCFATVYDKERAREFAEPEDQDYYGIGSRSARFSINMLICLIFGTLCPWMNLLGFINFLLCRIYYGYLQGFAEIKKPDLGGQFWVQQLRQLFIGSIIYVIMMTGVLYARASTSGPAIIAVLSLIFVVWRMRRFEQAFVWEKLPFQVLAREKLDEPRSTDERYFQPELLDPEERSIMRKTSMLEAVKTARKSLARGKTT